MRYNLFVDGTGYGREVEGDVVYPLPSSLFPYLLQKGLASDTTRWRKKIPKEYT